MKKFIVRVLLFIPFVSFFYIVLLLAGSSVFSSMPFTNLKYPVAGYAHMYSRIAEVKQTKDIDILFLGASFAYRGFDPRIFKQYGYKTFNLGSSNQTPIQTKLLLDRYLRTLNPKMIVLEVAPRSFMFDGVESSLDVIANDEIDLKTLKMALTLNNVRTYNTLIYGYFRQIFNINKGITEDAAKGDDLYIPGGFVEKKVIYNRDFSDNPAMRWVPIPYQIESFESILKLIRKHNIRLFLVQAPLTQAENEIFEADQELIDNYFLSKTSNYFNFNRILKLNDSLHFIDSRHLNQHGVVVFNREVIRKIQRVIKPSEMTANSSISDTQ